MSDTSKKGKRRADSAARSSPKCFWFSGTSGTKIRHALAALQAAFAERGRSVQVVSVEDDLFVAYAEFSRPRNTTERALHLERLRRPGGFKEILDEAPAVVQELWKRAATAASAKAGTYLENGDDVFFTFHGVYYADKFGDFYSPVDSSVIRKFPAPTKFITFIDDIGDIAVRLRAEGHVFSNREKAQLQSVTEAIRDLLTILEWRSTEFTVAKLLGSLVDRPPFLLAVKHPISTAVRLLLDRGTPTYISHSITEERRMFVRTNEWPDFTKEVQRFTDHLAHGSDAHDVPTPLIPIVPTSIDELRIRSGKIHGKTVLLPALLDRWPEPSGKQLVPTNLTQKTANWLDPCGYFEEKLGDTIPQHTESDIQAVDGLLQALQTRIDNQVNARDHTLVAQCPHLVVYRPYIAWGISRGVAAEIAHRKRLQPRPGETIFLHKPPGDDDFRKLGIVVESCVLSFRWTKGARTLSPEEVGEVLRGLFRHEAPPDFSAAAIESHLKTALYSQGIEFGGPLALDKNAILAKASAADAQNRAAQLWREIEKALNEPDPWRSQVTWVRKSLQPEQFALEAEKIAGRRHQKSRKNKAPGAHYKVKSRRQNRASK